MATVYIEEYSSLATVFTSHGPYKSPGQAPQEPSIRSQVVPIAASSTQSIPFDPRTLMVRVHVDAICSIAFGFNPVALTVNKRLAANQTEYFGVVAGQLLAAIANV